MYNSASPIERVTFGTPGAPFGSANGASNPMLVDDDGFVEITIITAGFTGTLKMATSDQNAAPDFAATSADGNSWSTQLCDNDPDGASVLGDTGIAFSAETSTRKLRLNADLSKWLGFILSGVSAGTIKIDVKHGSRNA